MVVADFVQVVLGKDVVFTSAEHDADPVITKRAVDRIR